MNRRNSLLLALALAGVTVQGSAIAQDEAQDDRHNFTTTFWGVSEYVWRGVSQSDESPAFQAAFDYEHASGFYAGIWGSSVDFVPDDAPFEDEDGADVEIDYYIGYAFDLNDRLAGDVQLIRYDFPGTNDGIDYAFNEVIGKLTFDEWLTGSIGWSNDQLASDESGVHYELSGSWSLPAELTLSAGIAHYDLDDVLGDSYNYWNVGVSRPFGMFEIGVQYIGTDSSAEDLFGGYGDDRFVASISFKID